MPDHRRALRTFHGQKLEKHLTPAEREAADAFIHKHFRFLVPDDETETNLTWLLETMALACTSRITARVVSLAFRA